MAVNNNSRHPKNERRTSGRIITILSARQYFIHFGARKLLAAKFFDRYPPPPPPSLLPPPPSAAAVAVPPPPCLSIYPPYEAATFLPGVRKSITRRLAVEYGVRKLAPRRTSVSEVVRQGGTKSRVAFFTRVQLPVGVVKRRALVALTIANIILSF